MTKKQGGTTSTWIDPDDAPEWTDEDFAAAELRSAEQVIRPATGTLKRRGRPPSDNPKQQVTIRLDGRIVEWFKQGGPGWQSRINDYLMKAVGS